jgi:hypothetical protein
VAYSWELVGGFRPNRKMKRDSSIAHWHIGDHDPKCKIKAFEATNQENSTHQST